MKKLFFVIFYIFEDPSISGEKDNLKKALCTRKSLYVIHNKNQDCKSNIITEKTFSISQSSH